jgi:hypothetical protein
MWKTIGKKRADRHEKHAQCGIVMMKLIHRFIHTLWIKHVHYFISTRLFTSIIDLS